MNQYTDRRPFRVVAAAAGTVLMLLLALAAGQQDDKKKDDKKGGKKNADGGSFTLPADLSMYNSLSVVLGRASDKSVAVSLLGKETLEAFIEYGIQPGKYDEKTKPIALPAGQPFETTLTDLRPSTRYYYRLQTRKPRDGEFKPRPECQFHTQRSAGSTFIFCVQGDSHPERPFMCEPNLYARTLQHAASCRPDLYFCMGDDFSPAKVRTYDAEHLAAPYLLQRPFLGLVAQSTSLYLVNGNQDQGSLFNFNQTDERHRVAVGVQNARNKFFPMPATEGIYTGDAKRLEGIGLLRDYYAWTWGDALFVVIDNYWHSPALVDSPFQKDGKKGDDKKNRDGWSVTLGDEQYQWFKKTLEGSKAKFKFVFAHHVMGTGRGGVEASERYEWGGMGKGKGPAGDFKTKRPGWQLPVHQLMVKHGVSIFFQGHDHLYARQERDGVVYQEAPVPADHKYATGFADGYTSGTKLPNSGYLRVTVSPQEAKVDYVRCWLPKDETARQKTGDIAHTYTVEPRAQRQ